MFGYYFNFREIFSIKNNELNTYSYPNFHGIVCKSYKWNASQKKSIRFVGFMLLPFHFTWRYQMTINSILGNQLRAYRNEHNVFLDIFIYFNYFYCSDLFIIFFFLRNFIFDDWFFFYFYLFQIRAIHIIQRFMMKLSFGVNNGAIEQHLHYNS